MTTYTFKQKLDILDSGALPDNLPSSTISDWRKHVHTYREVVRLGFGSRSNMSTKVKRALDLSSNDSISNKKQNNGDDSEQIEQLRIKIQQLTHDIGKLTTENERLTKDHDDVTLDNTQLLLQIAQKNEFTQNRQLVYFIATSFKYPDLKNSYDKRRMIDLNSGELKWWSEELVGLFDEVHAFDALKNSANGYENEFATKHNIRIGSYNDLEVMRKSLKKFDLMFSDQPYIQNQDLCGSGSSCARTQLKNLQKRYKCITCTVGSVHMACAITRYYPNTYENEEEQCGQVTSQYENMDAAVKTTHDISVARMKANQSVLLPEYKPLSDFLKDSRDAVYVVHDVQEEVRKRTEERKRKAAEKEAQRVERQRKKDAKAIALEKEASQCAEYQAKKLAMPSLSYSEYLEEEKEARRVERQRKKDAKAAALDLKASQCAEYQARKMVVPSLTYPEYLEEEKSKRKAAQQKKKAALEKEASECAEYQAKKLAMPSLSYSEYLKEARHEDTEKRKTAKAAALEVKASRCAGFQKRKKEMPSLSYSDYLAEEKKKRDTMTADELWRENMMKKREKLMKVKKLKEERAAKLQNEL